MLRHSIKLASGFLLALSAVVCGGPSAQAQTVVFDQIGSNPSLFGTAGYASQIYDDPYAASTTGLVDDFTLTNSSLLHITNVQAAFTNPGSVFLTTSLSKIEGWEVDIYTTKPGDGTTVVGDFSQDVSPASVTYTSPFTPTVSSSALVSIPVDFTLPGTGTYYIAVLAKNNLQTNGTVFMDYSTGPFLGGGNDFNFTPGSTGIFAMKVTPRNGDAAYRITASPTAVPEPTTWALLAAGGLVLAAGVTRRQARAATPLA